MPWRNPPFLSRQTQRSVFSLHHSTQSTYSEWCKEEGGRSDSPITILINPPFVYITTIVLTDVVPPTARGHLFMLNLALLSSRRTVNISLKDAILVWIFRHTDKMLLWHHTVKSICTGTLSISCTPEINATLYCITPRTISTHLCWKRPVP